MHKVTKLKSLTIENFRGLKDINIALGNKLTVICGKNGTSKSTILGLIAQLFNFVSDPSKKPAINLKIYKTLSDELFHSKFSEHFRISESHDIPGSMTVKYEVFDAYVNKNLNNLSLGLYDSKDRKKPRAIIRGNDGIPNINTSRNVTHPVIYLSLKRLLPISLRDEYNKENNEYIQNNEYYINLCNNQILNINSPRIITTTRGTIDSLVAHGNNYDHESISVGEDNTGQIIQAILSFKRLKETYQDYHGGILLIDEVDAGLFPADQLNLIKVLRKAAKDFNLQVIMTSHSPIIIEKIFELSKKAKPDFKTIYLTDTFGNIAIKHDYSWPKIKADLLVDIIRKKDKEKLQKITIYFKDKEAFDLFSQIITKQKIKRLTEPLRGISIGCENLLDLMGRKIPEFTKNSIIILDGDAANNLKSRKIKSENLCLLPTEFSPDKLIFEFMYNLAENHEYWENDLGFTKCVFFNITTDIKAKLKLGEAPINLNAAIENHHLNNAPQAQNEKGVIRQLFKKFVNNECFQKLLDNKKHNPYTLWAKHNPKEIKKFQDNFLKALDYTLSNRYEIDNTEFKKFIEKFY